MFSRCRNVCGADHQAMSRRCCSCLRVNKREGRFSKSHRKVLKKLFLCKLEIIFDNFYRYQSGFQPPGDIAFEDLSKADSDTSNHSSNNISALNIVTGKGTMGANKLKKRVGIFNIFSSNKVHHH